MTCERMGTKPFAPIYAVPWITIVHLSNICPLIVGWRTAFHIHEMLSSTALLLSDFIFKEFLYRYVKKVI